MIVRPESQRFLAEAFELSRRETEVLILLLNGVSSTARMAQSLGIAEPTVKAEYQIALVDLVYATGMLLGAAKVQWEPIVPVIK